jgi:hypothetical protein
MSMTTEQMKQALAAAGVTNEPKPVSDFSSADVVAAIGSGAVAAAEEAVSGTIGFFDRVGTRYRFNRAVRQGLIPSPDAKPEIKVQVTARRTAKAS